MPLTDVAIANIAMDFLGESPISSISNPSNTNERLVARNYEQVVQEELAKRRWSFAIQHPSLPADPSASHPARKNAFFLPPDILRILRPQLSDWIVQRPYLYSDEAAPLTVTCIKRVDESEFDPLFNPVVGAALALRLTQTVSGSAEQAQEAREQYRVAVREAAASNAFQRGPVDIPEGGWVEAARHGAPLDWGTDRD